MEPDRLHDVSEERAVEGRRGQTWTVRRGRTFYRMTPILSPPEQSAEPDWVVEATNVGGDHYVSQSCESEAHARRVFEQFVGNIETFGGPMPYPA
jgi:hypothetical protein